MKALLRSGLWCAGLAQRVFYARHTESKLEPLTIEPQSSHQLSERTTAMPDEKGAPPQVKIESLNDYLEVMSKAVFQSGMSWRVVNAKWPDTNEAFHGFEIGRVAALTEEELDELAQDKRVIRNRRKLAAVVYNAQRIIELDTEHGGFINYLRSHGDFYDVAKDLRKQFKFLGDTGCYFFLYVVGEPVPPHEEWMRVREQSARR